MRLIAFIIAALSLAAPAFAQSKTPVSITILQNMIGQLAGENAQLVEQAQNLSTANSELQKQIVDLHKQIDDKKKPPEDKK